jgi:hypothetical protein
VRGIFEPPYFNLFWYFFCLKKKGGSREFKIAGGEYLKAQVWFWKIDET